MECFIFKKNNEKEITNISDDIYNSKYNEILIHQLIVSYIANSHTGVKKQKSRSEVRGGGKKPWKQKGTGRARVGSIRSPLWRGGGKIFAFKGLKKKKKINKKMYNLGMKMILSQLIRDNKLIFIEDLNIHNHKTKNFINEISFIDKKQNILIILEKITLNIYLATKNINNIIAIDYKNINPFLLCKYQNILITKSAIKKIEDTFK